MTNKNHDKIVKFLSFFGNPFVGIIPEKGIDSTKKFKINKYRSLEENLRINEEAPYCLAFTPNGNFGKHVVPGSDCKGVRTKQNCQDNDVNAFFVEIDVKFSEEETKEGLWKHMNRCFIVHQCYPSFVVETPNGYHVYWILDESARRIATFDGVFLIMDFLIDIFEADKNNALSKEKYMRLPYSYHWKTGEPKQVILWQVIDGKWTQDVDFDRVKCFNESQYKNAIKYSEEKKNYQKMLSKTTKNFNLDIIGDLHAIDMKDMINNKLKGIPMTYCQKQFVFYVDENGSISVNMKKTDGYKMNRQKNYVNCFTSEYHPIDERPRGGVVAFLYYYFQKDFVRVNHFLKNNYGISLFSKKENEMEHEVDRIDMLDYSVIFTTLRVSIRKILHTSKGETSQHETVVIRNPVKIIGRAKVYMNTDATMSEMPDEVYLMEISGVPSVVRISTCAKKFNEKNKGIIGWYGNDHDLIMFFEALKKSNIEDMQVVERNGYFFNNFYLGGKPFKKEENVFNAISHRYDVDFDTNNVSVKVFFEAMKKVFKEDVCVCALLGGIACSGMNLRGQKNVYPGVLISGITGTGKSTLRDMVKWGLGYKGKSRQYDYRGLTPQPLKQYATDYSILWLEEITGQSKIGTEQVLHYIMNRESSARGVASGNIFYDVKAPLFCTGERMFSGGSLNNRFVIIPFGMSDRQPDTQRNDIFNVQSMSIAKDVYEKYIEVGESINEEYNKVLEMLSIEGFDSRASDVWGYLFVVNRVFGNIVSEERLKEIAKKMLKKVGLGEKKNIPPEKQLYFFLSEAMSSRDPKIVAFFDYELGKFDFQFVNENFYEENRGKVNSIIDDLLEAGVVIWQTEKGFSFSIDVVACVKKDLEGISQAAYNLYFLLDNVKTIGRQYITVAK